MNKRQSSGLSLIEFTLALTFVALLALGIAPMYYKFMNNYRASNFANSLVHALQFARGKAVSRAEAVSVCASSDGRTCSATPWSRGYIVFTDTDHPGTVDAEDMVLRTTTVRRPDVNVTLTGGSFVRFYPNGGLVATAPAEPSSTLLAQHAAGHWLARLSPVAQAVASDVVPNGVPAFIVNNPAKAVQSGAFTVCVGPSGRAINISYLGRITTSRVPCY